MRSLPNLFIRRSLPGIAATGLLAAAAFCLSPASVRAQDATPPPLQPAETPPPPQRVVPRAPTPEPAVDAPVATPTPKPRVRAPRAEATPASDEPAAVVNGKPVYRPLFRSIVPDPVDRALALQDYHHRGLVLPANALEDAVKNHTKTGFGDQATLIAKLHEQGASFDDYRAFVAEEVRLSAILGIVSKNGRTEADRKALQSAWLADLRKKANVNTPKKT